MESGSGEETQSIMSESDTGSRSMTESETGSKTSNSYTTSETVPSVLRAHAQNASLAATRRKRMLSQWSPLRQSMMELVESKPFNNFILSIIFVNTTIITAQTDKRSEMAAGWYFSVCDCIFLGIYISEMLTKLYVYRTNYFKSGWNTFDFVIVLTSFVDWLRFAIAMTSAINPKIFRLLRVFRAIRALRALRTLRAVSFLQSLQVIVSTLLKSIPALGSIVLLLFLILYVFAVIGRNLYGDLVPDKFGSIWSSIFTLFSIITLDDWFQIYRRGYEKEPLMILFLIAFIVIETFVLINLFIAVIVNNLQASQSYMKKKLKKAKAKEEVEEQQRKEFASSAKKKRFVTAEADGGPKSVDSYYGDDNIPHRQKQLMGSYLMLLASLENNYDIYQNHQRVLDELVDIVAPKEDEDIVVA
eukprot:TRINITY_DN2265_c0_g2_i1.p1 TRINITY_DN2265_c0_g2~~TRINITY_DN2265_c0_g2_i1.p1  ORF type:complete len:416 (+),score=98.91 TRINITY_DN2265_c0_g2_i1:89-1336(+)